MCTHSVSPEPLPRGRGPGIAGRAPLQNSAPRGAARKGLPWRCPRKELHPHNRNSSPCFLQPPEPKLISLRQTRLELHLRTRHGRRPKTETLQTPLLGAKAARYSPGQPLAARLGAGAAARRGPRGRPGAAGQGPVQAGAQLTAAGCGSHPRGGAERFLCEPGHGRGLSWTLQEGTAALSLCPL